MWDMPPKKRKRFGWCRYHRLWVTVKQARKARCLESECPHFKKNKNHQLWRLKNKRTAESDAVDNAKECKV
ncbi:MAG: hypothetical protein FH756_02270 [Firmicutes bacterium]|nr:hypothetical protein [Bacillota bacterium]